MKAIKKFMSDDQGATAIEYGLIASLIAVAIIAALTFLGFALKNSFDNTSSAIESTNP